MTGAGAACPAEGRAIDPVRRANAQAEVRRALESAGERAVLIAGPAGSGKTTLLLGLAAELAPPRRAVYLAQPRLPLGGFWMRLAGELDLEPGYDAKRRVLRRAAELAREGGGLVLVVDDAHELPAETLYALLATARSEPGLQLLLARSDDASLAGPLPDDVPVVRTGRMAPVAAEAAAPVETRALPALTARRRRRERRARAAFAAAGLAAGLAIGTLLSAPAWRAIQRAQAPPTTPDVAAPAATPPLADQEPARAAQPAPEAAAPQDAAPDLAARAVERAVAVPVGEPEAIAEPPRERGEVPPLGASPQARSEAPAPAAAPPMAAPAPALTAPAPAPGAPAEHTPPPAARANEPAPQPAAPSAPTATPPDVAAPPPPVWRPRPGPPAAGRLAVSSDSDVRIEIDGRLYGAVPLVGIQLSRGEHRVMAHYPDGAVALKTIYLDDENVSVFFR